MTLAFIWQCQKCKISSKYTNCKSCTIQFHFGPLEDKTLYREDYEKFLSLFVRDEINKLRNQFYREYVLASLDIINFCLSLIDGKLKFPYTTVSSFYFFTKFETDDFYKIYRFVLDHDKTFLKHYIFEKFMLEEIIVKDFYSKRICYEEILKNLVPVDFICKSSVNVTSPSHEDFNKLVQLTNISKMKIYKSIFVTSVLNKTMELIRVFNWYDEVHITTSERLEMVKYIVRYSFYYLDLHSPNDDLFNIIKVFYEKFKELIKDHHDEYEVHFHFKNNKFNYSHLFYRYIIENFPSIKLFKYKDHNKSYKIYFSKLEDVEGF